MITRLPEFAEGIHYRELSPEEGKRRWRYQLLETLAVKLTMPFEEHISFRDREGREWGRLLGPVLKIAGGYTWNGCSPKRWVPVIGWVGTPDTPRNLLGSCVHDFMCQFRDTAHFPFSREHVDAVFYDILRKSYFAFAGTFHGAVADMGWMFKQPPDGSHSVLVLRRAESAASGVA